MYNIILCTLFLICTLLAGASCANKSITTQTMTAEEKNFEQLIDTGWKEVFFDSCTKNWKEKWFLDGLKATVTNSKKGMDFISGPVAGDDSCHAVLWTKESFKGDIKIEYEYTRIDEENRNVNILYVQATGSGQGPYSKDILQWANLRTVPSMLTYYNNMNTYHISYAAFDNNNDDPTEDYIRARRYMPVEKKGLAGTDLKPDYFRTGFFKTSVPHKITVVKKGDNLYMHIINDEKQMLCHWINSSFPPIEQGRIGLRHMYARGARYKNFRISQLKE